MKNCIVTMIAVLFLMTGCAGMTDQQRTRGEGTAVGAGIGAVAGGLIGQETGKNTESTLIGTGIGATIGGLAGYIYGDHVAKQKAQYINDEDNLNACIVSARQRSNELKKWNDSRRRKISDYRQKIRKLVQKYNRRQVSVAQMQREKQELIKGITDLNYLLGETKQQIAQYQQMIRKSQNVNRQTIASLNSEISKLEQAADELEQQTQALASINQSIKL